MLKHEVILDLAADFYVKMRVRGRIKSNLALETYCQELSIFL